MMMWNMSYVLLQVQIIHLPLELKEIVRQSNVVLTR